MSAVLERALDHITDPEDRAVPVREIRHEIRRRHRRASASAETLKVCPSCNTAKTHADFNRHASRPDGLDWKCRACLSTPAAPRAHAPV